MLKKRTLFGVIASLAVLTGALVALASQTELAPRPQAEGSVSGQVSSAAEGSMEGVVVTARREGSTIAVSVISDARGRYRFPAGRLEAGQHALSIRAVGYDLEGPKAAEVGASGMTTVDLALRPTQDLEAQLTNAEWLESIPGTEDQKRMFESCVRCHTLDRVMRSQYDSRAWLGCPGTNGWLCDVGFPGQPAEAPRRPGDTVRRAERAAAGSSAAAGRLSGQHQFELRSTEYDLKTFPRPTGRATQAIITEYDLPNPSTAPHDAEVDPDGMVWYVDFGQQYLGKLDPRTGEVTEYQVPEARPGNPTGTLAVKLDRDGNPWGGNMFQGSIFNLTVTPRSSGCGRFPMSWSSQRDRTAPASSRSTTRHPESSHVDGKVWLQNRSIAGVHRLDLATGEFESFEPFLNSTRSSHNLYGIQPDSHNNLWFMDFANEHIGRIDAKTGEINLYETPTLRVRARAGARSIRKTASGTLDSVAT